MATKRKTAPRPRATAKKRAKPRAKKRAKAPASRHLPETVAAAALAKILGVDERSVQNFAHEGMPKADRAEYPLARCVQWYLKRETAAARASRGLNDLDRARHRKLEAEGNEAELRVKQLTGELIPMTEHEAVVGEVCDRLRATIVNLPSTFSMKLEEAGVPAAAAEAVLETIAEELITALRGTADELEAETPAAAPDPAPAAEVVDVPVAS